MKRQLFSLIGLLSLVLASCHTHYQLDGVAAQYTDVSDSEEGSAIVETTILPYRDSLNSIMTKVVGNAPEELKKAKPQGTLGNWFSDALVSIVDDLDITDVDFAIVNYGGIRVPYLPKGEITVGNIFELMPFENYLVIVELDSSACDSFFQYMAYSGAWPISETAAYELVGKKAKNIHIGGKPLYNKTYRIAMSDYIANGGDKATFLKNKKVENTGILLRDALFMYLEKEPILKSKIDGRVVVPKE